MRGNTFLAIGLLILSTFYFAQGKSYLEKSYAYPYEYRNIVLAAAEKEHVSPSLIAAVILAESKFVSTASSGPGAVGLMQLMPETAHWIREQMNQPEISDGDLQTPAINIEMGSWYLSYLLNEFGNNKILALAAYNAGRGHVEEWKKTYGWDNSFSAIDTIPFPETREYVRRVLQYEEKYFFLYGGE